MKNKAEILNVLNEKGIGIILDNNYFLALLNLDKKIVNKQLNGTMNYVYFDGIHITSENMWTKLMIGSTNVRVGVEKYIANQGTAIEKEVYRTKGEFFSE